MNKYLIIGLGIFGRSLAQHLMASGAEVVAIDQNMKLVDEIQDFVIYAACLDSTDEKALDGLDLKDFQVAIVCIGENFEASLLTAVLLKQKGIPKVIARASDPTRIRILKAVGIDQIISPDIEAAERLAYSLLYEALFDVTYIGGNTVAARIQVSPDFVGKTLGKLDLRAKYGVNVIAIQHEEQVVQEDGSYHNVKTKNNTPGADTVIAENDVLVLIGEKDNVNRMMRDNM